MDKRLFAFICLNIALCAPISARAIEKQCPHETAPAKFRINERQDENGKNPKDSGISSSGFVDLADGTPVIHGIDVSKYQDDVSLIPARECGARFAYVRLSSGDAEKNELLGRTLYANARAADIIPGPYHHLAVLRDSEAKLLGLTSAQLSVWVAKNSSTYAAYAAAQAKLFAQKSSEVFSLDQNGFKGRMPFALDLSERPLAKGTPEQKKAIAPLYREMACTFIKAINDPSSWPKDIPEDRRVVIFMDPDDFISYDFNASSCTQSWAALWVRYRPRDGDTYVKTASSAAAAAVCNSTSSQGRCLLEQYTSFGGFALFAPGAPLDLDRFVGTQEAFDKFVRAK